MAAIAGSKGRVEEARAEATPSRAVLANQLLTGDMPVEHALGFFRDNAKLREISVEVNMICNLQCSYCYLSQRNAERTLPLQLWKARLLDAALQGVRLIAIVGKEPFIDERGPELLAFLDQIRGEHRLDFRCGAVTNGTLLERHVGALAKIGSIDYLDISLDGIGLRHDEIRGRGSFERAMRGFHAVRGLTNVGSLFVNNTLHSRNVNALPGFVLGMAQRGVENLHFSPVLNFTADPSVDNLLLSPSQVRTVIEELADLAVEVPGQTVFEVPIEYVWCFLGDGTISADLMREDGNGVLYIQHRPDRRFFLKTALFPGYFWSNARITHDGLYLSELDTVAWALPEHAIGNVRDHSIHDLFAIARGKGGWFERYFHFTLQRLIWIARRGKLTSNDFPHPDAWRRSASDVVSLSLLEGR